MNTFAKFLPLGLLFAACGTMRETTQVRDDVYDIPDRAALASAAATAPADAAPAPAETDYYDAQESQAAGVSRDYYDMTYNDPYYYNYGRFGFGASVNSWGPGYGMGLSYGWPTSWGSMSIGYGYGMGMGYSPWGYNPYWGNSWMSGYGYGNPWGYYGYGNYGYPGYGYGYGWSPYQGPWGGCYGCYEPIGYSSVVYGHRPSMTGSSGNMNTSQTGARRMYRNPAGLIQQPQTESTRQAVTRPGRTGTRDTQMRRDNTPWTRPAREVGRETRPAPGRETRPSRNWSFGSGDAPSRSGGDGGSRSGGGGGNSGGGGGGRVTSPRPR
ncbi:MAG: hypothetical protein JST66_15270 [Bacteroidetes bacterium]|nr:hypothetical protein [Bacteroidota bacterium]